MTAPIQSYTRTATLHGIPVLSDTRRVQLFRDLMTALHWRTRLEKARAHAINPAAWAEAHARAEGNVNHRRALWYAAHGALLLMCAMLVGCEPDWAALSAGVPSMACEYSPVESAVGQVPEGECWRVVSIGEGTRLRLEGESCGDMRECLTATAGQRVYPSVNVYTFEGDFDATPWDCDALATACDPK
jgi:hypothetical protein